MIQTFVSLYKDLMVYECTYVYVKFFGDFVDE